MVNAKVRKSGKVRKTAVLKNIHLPQQTYNFREKNYLTHGFSEDGKPSFDVHRMYMYEHVIKCVL